MVLSERCNVYEKIRGGIIKKSLKAHFAIMQRMPAGIPDEALSAPVNTTPQMTCFRGAKVHTMASGKSDDELTQHDNKMRIWTRSGKFRKVENPELSTAWRQSMTRTPMTTSMIAWHCTMRTPLTTSTDIHMSVARTVSLFSLVSVTSSAHALRLKMFESFHVISMVMSM